MRFSTILAALSAGLVAAAPTPELQPRTETVNGIEYNVFTSEANNATVKFVKNSGICETTPGVNQYSGYLTVGTNMNMWFWFFEARNSPTTAPLATWFNGGPGCSSMIGLFQENGPCHFVNGASTPSLNPNSWNNFANMLYIDQPIGVGFSYGDDEVTSTVTAAPYVWTLIQMFYKQFPQYTNRDFGVFTESYGGHYGPEFAYYIEQQNAAIKAGSVSGTTINLVALGVNNGWFDHALQEKAYIDYSYNNSYRKIISQSQYNSYLSKYNNDCLPAVKQCTATTGQNSACSNAETVCGNEIENPLINAADFDVYDIREPSNDPAAPSEAYVTYLQSKSVMTAIGAQSTYQECPNAAYNKFQPSGDIARSLLPALSSVVQSGIQVLIWAGDADWICNYMGGFAVANAVTYSQSSTFKAAALKSYTVAGKAGGLFKTAGNLSWLQVFGAGHEVPFYQPALAFQAFKQTLSKQPLSST